jgi:hypothetical protein
MWKSWGEYLSAFGFWGFLMLAPLSLDVLTVYQVASGDPNLPGPVWVYVALGFLLTFLVPFLAFHKMRLERDAAQELLKARHPDLAVVSSSMEDKEVKDMEAQLRAMLHIQNVGDAEAARAHILAGYAPIKPRICLSGGVSPKDKPSLGA